MISMCGMVKICQSNQKVTKESKINSDYSQIRVAYWSLFLFAIAAKPRSIVKNKCCSFSLFLQMLSRDCEDHVRSKIREAALDYRQDPVLAQACRIEVSELAL